MGAIAHAYLYLADQRFVQGIDIERRLKTGSKTIDDLEPYNEELRRIITPVLPAKNDLGLAILQAVESSISLVCLGHSRGSSSGWA